MFLDKAEDLPRFDLLSRSVQIDQKDSGVIIIVICAEPELIDVVCQLGFPRMGGRSGLMIRISGSRYRMRRMLSGRNSAARSR